MSSLLQAMTKKRSSDFFQEKIGWHPSVAAPYDPNPSDATAWMSNVTDVLRLLRSMYGHSATLPPNVVGFLDSLSVFKSVWPNLQSRSLPSLIHSQLPSTSHYTAHDAVDDTRALQDLWETARRHDTDQFQITVRDNTVATHELLAKYGPDPIE